MAYSRKSRANRTVNLSSVIDQTLEKYGLFDGVFASRLKAEKDQIFGHFSPHIKGIEYLNGRLTLQFDSDAWRHVAEEKRSQLLKLVNDYAPGKISKIFFV